jgi:hypothetical protein
MKRQIPQTTTFLSSEQAQLEAELLEDVTGDYCFPEYDGHRWKVTRIDVSGKEIDGL